MKLKRTQDIQIDKNLKGHNKRGIQSTVQKYLHILSKKMSQKAQNITLNIQKLDLL